MRARSGAPHGRTSSSAASYPSPHRTGAVRAGRMSLSSPRLHLVTPRAGTFTHRFCPDLAERLFRIVGNGRDYLTQGTPETKRRA